MNTDFIILCGGQGTRLRTAIGEHQKVMARVGHEPFLDLLLKYIRNQGGRRVILCTGYKSDDVELHYPGGKFQDMAVEFSHEDEPLGTGGAIKKALARVKTENVFVLNGDSFCPIDYAKMFKFHQSHKAAGTIAVCKAIDAQDYGTISLDDQAHISAFREKAVMGVAFVNAGVYCFKHAVQSIMPDTGKFSIEHDFFHPQAGQGSLYGFVVEESFFDIGTPERYELAKKYLK